MKIIPVMDILNGQVVRAAGGLRSQYKPLVSPLLKNAGPFHFVERLMESFNFELFYIADLNAIMKQGDNQAVIKELAERSGARFLVDGGYTSQEDILESPAITPVIGVETFTRWEAVKESPNAFFSLDTKNGELVSAKKGMTIAMALEILRRAGHRKYIHLRLEAVGGRGFNPAAALSPFSGEEWLYGGGVTSCGDIMSLEKAGYGGALVSTALHDGVLLESQQAI
ncbi:MAG: hypothetical protein HY751_12790 [Nitrospinae bacterium]|nr:hypothetical protein [Nitrospinota bacterium]